MHICAVYQQQSKIVSKPLPDDTVVSTSAVFPTAISKAREYPAQMYITSAVKLYINSHQKLKRKHFWTTPPCRPGRYINRDSCISTAIRNESESASDRHSRVDLGGVSTAISKAKASLAPLYITSVVYMYIRGHHCKCESTSGRHSFVDQSGVSTARAVYQQQSQNWSESISGRHSRVDLGGLSTTISKTKNYLPQLYITGAV